MFRLPSIRIEDIRTARHRVTEINHCIYWTMPWLGLLKPALRRYVRAFLRQDRDIMERQQQGLRFSPPLTLIDDADTQAKWYYRLKREYLRARAGAARSRTRSSRAPLSGEAAGSNQKWRPKAPFAVLRCRFSLHSVTPSPYEAQQEESRAEQRQAGRLRDRVGARGRNDANR